MILDNPRPVKLDDLGAHWHIKRLNEKLIRPLQGGVAVESYIPKGRFYFGFRLDLRTGVVVRYDYESGELRYRGPHKREFEAVHAQTKSRITDWWKGCVQFTADRRAICCEVAKLVEGQNTGHRSAANIEYNANDRFTVSFFPEVKSQLSHIMCRQIVADSICHRFEQLYCNFGRLHRFKKKAGLIGKVASDDRNFLSVDCHFRCASIGEFVDHAFFLSGGEVSTPSATGAGLASSLPRQGGAA